MAWLRGIVEGRVKDRELMVGPAPCAGLFMLCFRIWVVNITKC